MLPMRYSERSCVQSIQLTVIVSRSGPKAASLWNLIVFVPALSVTGMLSGTGVAKLLPVRFTTISAPPFTLMSNVLLPDNRYVNVSVFVPALGELTLLIVTELAAPLPMKPTFRPPEQAAHVAILAAPAMVLPDASASIVVAPAAGTSLSNCTAPAPRVTL